MGCCACKPTPPHEEVAKEPGVKIERRCQDCLFLLLFIAFWVGMIIVAIQARKVGDPQRLLYGIDYLGNVCGTNNIAQGIVPAEYARDFTDHKYLYYIFYLPSPSKRKVCLPSCPGSGNGTLDNQTFVDTAVELVCPYNLTANESNIFIGGCYPAYGSSPLLNRCVPFLNFFNQTDLKDFAQDIISDLNLEQEQDTSVKMLADLARAWRYILIFSFVALVLAFVWLLFLRLFAGFVVWSTVLLVLLSLGALAYICHRQAGELQTQYDATPVQDRLVSMRYNISALTYITYIVIAIGAILVLALICVIGRIRLAIGLIKETSRAVITMPSLFLVPVFVFIFVAGLAAYWVGISVLLGTASRPTYDSDGIFTGYQAEGKIRYLQLYHLFGGFWSLNFILAVGHTIIAGSIAAWYWVLDHHKRPTFPVAKAAWRTVRYSLGSLAFGSLILAIVQFIRYMLEYLQKRFHGKEAFVARFVIKCMKCCFDFLERFIKFLNEKAYIMIAIYGYSFCEGAKRGLELTAENFVRVIALNCIANFMMFLGKLFICAITTFAAFIMLNKDPLHTGVSFYVLPCILIAIISFAIATGFMSVYDMAIDTMLFCFCEDEARNDGSPEKPYYMPKSLRKFVDSSPSSACGCCC